jgi:catechol 2,3-dioxygenase-like lactoylglutathione lyase family enzyme
MPETSDLGQAQIGQISITVHDLDRAVAFYKDKLGLRHLFTVSKLGFFDCGGIRLMLAVPESPEFDHPSSVLYFNVNDIQTVFTGLSERGIRFEGPPHLIAKMDNYDLWMAFFRDSENNLLSLMSNVPRRQ